MQIRGKIPVGGKAGALRQGSEEIEAGPVPLNQRDPAGVTDGRQMTAQAGMIDLPRAAELGVARLTGVEVLQAPAHGGEGGVPGLTVRSQSSRTQVQPESGMVDRVDKHVAFAGRCAEIAFSRRKLVETQHRAMRLDARQQEFQERPALQPGHSIGQTPPPSGAQNQRLAAKIPANRRQLREVVDRAAAYAGHVEQAEIGPSGQQAMQSHNLQSRRGCRLPVRPYLGGWNAVPWVEPSMGGSDLQAFDPNRRQNRQQIQVLEGRKNKV